jgi:hypothetical protein
MLPQIPIYMIIPPQAPLQIVIVVAPVLENAKLLLLTVVSDTITQLLQIQYAMSMSMAISMPMSMSVHDACP